MSGDSEGASDARVSTSFLRSLPLFIASGIFFAFGAVVFVFDPHYGPGTFTLWALLLVLGFVAAIGGVASWLLVGEPEPEGSAAPAPHRSRRWENADQESDEPRVVLARSESGRPAPSIREPSVSPRYAPHPAEVAGAMGARGSPRRLPDWDETDTAESAPEVPEGGSGYASASEALHDLDGIEQELTPRGARGRTGTAST